jgi:hypothetical protein
MPSLACPSSAVLLLDVLFSRICYVHYLSITLLLTCSSPWQPVFCDWGFNLPRGEACLEKWQPIPAGVDLLVTHGPPLGHGDRCRGGNRAGCGNLLEEIEGRIRPKLHVFGHIHEDYGVSTNGTTVFANASNCNIRYDRHNLNAPLVFDVRVG